MKDSIRKIFQSKPSQSDSVVTEADNSQQPKSSSSTNMDLKNLFETSQKQTGREKEDTVRSILDHIKSNTRKSATEFQEMGFGQVLMDFLDYLTSREAIKNKSLILISQIGDIETDHIICHEPSPYYIQQVILSSLEKIITKNFLTLESKKLVINEMVKYTKKHLRRIAKIGKDRMPHTMGIVCIVMLAELKMDTSDAILEVANYINTKQYNLQTHSSLDFSKKEYYQYYVLQSLIKIVKEQCNKDHSLTPSTQEVIHKIISYVKNHAAEISCESTAKKQFTVASIAIRKLLDLERYGIDAISTILSEYAANIDLDYIKLYVGEASSKEDNGVSSDDGHQIMRLQQEIFTINKDDKISKEEKEKLRNIRLTEINTLEGKRKKLRNPYEGVLTKIKELQDERGNKGSSSTYLAELDLFFTEKPKLISGVYNSLANEQEGKRLEISKLESVQRDLMEGEKALIQRLSLDTPKPRQNTERLLIGAAKERAELVTPILFGILQGIPINPKMQEEVIKILSIESEGTEVAATRRWVSRENASAEVHEQAKRYIAAMREGRDVEALAIACETVHESTSSRSSMMI